MASDLKRFGLVVPVYNRERYIGAFLDSVVGMFNKIVVVLGDKPWPSHAYLESTVKDRSREIIESFDVDMVVGSYDDLPSQVNDGLLRAIDCEQVFVMDCDEFIQPDGYIQLFDTVTSDKDACWYMPYTNMIDFVYDYRYGRRNFHKNHGPVPMVLNPRISKLKPVYDFAPINHEIFHTRVIDDAVNIYHFRMAKHATDKEPESKDGWEQAPEYVTKLLNKWKTKLN